MLKTLFKGIKIYLYNSKEETEEIQEWDLK
jgi:hypothetical protein